MFIAEAVVGSGVILEFIILIGGSNVPSFILTRVRVEEVLYWIALDCMDVPNEVASDCIYRSKINLSTQRTSIT